MREELSGILQAIEGAELPLDAQALFGPMWSPDEARFVAQETYVADFKETVPTEFSRGYGAGIIRLALAFHNTFGGLIIFGVKDADFTCCGLDQKFEIEAFNSALTEMSSARIECLAREYSLSGTDMRICAVLVPRRGATRPVALTRPLEKYNVGTVWIRDRHSVKILGEADMPLLFSGRRDLAKSLSEDHYRSVHGSLPPSPATMQTFIGRADLLYSLWDWFVYDDKPRFYLHGPGGSGKSTLAYEFSRQVADRGAQVLFSGEECLDYVIFVSAKETELDPHTASIQRFVFNNFDDAPSQFRYILSESGLLAREEVAALPEEELPNKLEELFKTYTGLIVIDDIDALSRKSRDTGEETLLLAAIRASKRTRLLYTLRHPPPAALRSSLKVPALEETAEFPEFVRTCAAQLRVPIPQGKDYSDLADATSRLPLLTETVIGLRDVCGSYAEALVQFRDRGGREARKYLYQREYDRLEPDGRSREVLAALLLLEEAVSFSVLNQILGISADALRDAISECAGIFLGTLESTKGDVLYQLATPARAFIADVSDGLPHFGTIRRRVELYQAEEEDYTPEEAALIVDLDRLIRRREFKEAADLFEARRRHDPVLANQKVQSLVGRAYANLGADYRTRARECFKAASELGYADIYMMRTWFFVETAAEYGNKEAIAVCERYLAAPNLPTRDKAEFRSKLGRCYFEAAKRLRHVSREKTIEFFQKSIDANLSSLWIGRRVPELSEEQALYWLSQPAYQFVDYLGEDLEPFFEMLEALPERNHDVHPEGAKVLIQALRRTRAGKAGASRAKLVGLMRRTVQKLSRFAGKSEDLRGIEFLIRTLSVAQAQLDVKKQPIRAVS